MARTITLRLDDEVYQILSEAARAERRSLANLIETAALNRIREEQFVDDLEMAEIRVSENLIKRLQNGSKDARKRKGQFVE